MKSLLATRCEDTTTQEIWFFIRTIIADVVMLKRSDLPTPGAGNTANNCHGWAVYCRLVRVCGGRI